MPGKKIEVDGGLDIKGGKLAAEVDVRIGGVTVSADITLPKTGRRPEVSVGVQRTHRNDDAPVSDGKHRFTVGEAAVRFIKRGAALAFSTWLREQGLGVNARSVDEWKPLIDKFKNHPIAK